MGTRGRRGRGHRTALQKGWIPRQCAMISRHEVSWGCLRLCFQCRWEADGGRARPQRRVVSPCLAPTARPSARPRST